MLREHRDFRRGFEQRLQQRWGPALDLYECVRVCCLETGEDFQKRQDQQADGGSLKRSALTLLHARACLVASEVQGLLRSGHAAGAQARWRTLHELAVVAFVLGNHDPEISERFLLHRHVERYKDARQYQQYCEALGYEQFGDTEMEEIRQHRDEVVAPGKVTSVAGSTVTPSRESAVSTLAEMTRLVGMGHAGPPGELLGRHPASVAVPCCGGAGGSGGVASLLVEARRFFISSLVPAICFSMKS